MATSRPIRPGDVIIRLLGKWAVFVQSAAPNWKTVKDCEFLWDKTATGNVKPTWDVTQKKS
ncbi:MAG TPA: hypothetical protein PKE31_20055 [Pseudomonadota bacterium]|nr:hypothetical protein [Pseudomonadota bacterium]